MDELGYKKPSQQTLFRMRQLPEFGVQLNELRGYYDSDELFGKACAQLWTEIVQRNPDRKIPSRNTSLNLRKLQDFGELHECEAVGSLCDL